jgi:ABC-2 type transport system permease protein
VNRALRALPTLLRIGVAETVAYRAEFVVWLLTTTLPLVMMGLWTTVAAEGKFGNFDEADFVAYYLANLVVRNLTGSWVAWQISEEIRMGSMAMRLLRPIHPFFAIAASHIAAIPFRTAIALPFAVILLVSSGADALVRDPSQLVLLVPSIAMGWLITFSVLFAIGALAFFVTKAMALLNLYFGLFSVFSGYLLPLEMLPPVLAGIAEWSPFRFMLSLPVELMTRPMPPSERALLLAVQLAWTVASVLIAMFVWRRGVRRFEAVGS